MAAYLKSLPPVKNEGPGPFGPNAACSTHPPDMDMCITCVYV
jgi:hypothetical protein